MSQAFCYNAFEMQYLVLVAERRNCGKQPNGVENRRCDYQNDFAVNLHGVMGEFAAAKYLGLKLDHSVCLSGDDKIADMTYKSWRVQSKLKVRRSNSNPQVWADEKDM